MGEGELGLHRGGLTAGVAVAVAVLAAAAGVVVAATLVDMLRCHRERASIDHRATWSAVRPSEFDWEARSQGGEQSQAAAGQSREFSLSLSLWPSPAPLPLNTPKRPPSTIRQKVRKNRRSFTKYNACREWVPSQSTLPRECLVPSRSKHTRRCPFSARHFISPKSPASLEFDECLLWVFG